MEKREIKVPVECEGKRADQIIYAFFPELSPEIIRDAFKRRDVKLDHIRISKDTRVCSGQILQIYFISSPEVLPLDIVWEDQDILLVNKQSGISVEPDSHGGLTLTDLCFRHVREQYSDAAPPAACHRLDNKTSGLCLFSKNEKAHRILLDVFRERSMEKEYECLVKGIMKPPKAVCKAWLVKDSERAKVSVFDSKVPGSKEIITAYDSLSSGPISRLSVHLITGRTHQIRAHLAALGHPILGDDLYGDREFNKSQKCRTLKLCAVSLSLDTHGKLPALDDICFRINAPF